MQIVKILIPQMNLFPLDYLSKEEYEIGELVLVQLRNKKITGIVWDIVKNDDSKASKYVDTSLFKARIKLELIDFIQKSSRYYCNHLGSIAKLVLPVELNEGPIIEEKTDNMNFNLVPLSSHQQDALDLINKSTKPVLLKGVTGSGKTEIYFHLIMEYLLRKKQILVLLPEIALSTQIIARFTKSFGAKPTIWNSDITKARKKRILRGIISGQVRIVIGTRSALFLPYKNLAIIVVDEEHDISYKQYDGVLYNARDMAVLRAMTEKCRVILCSATPSIESIYNSRIRKYDFVQVTQRFNHAVLPVIQAIDMKRESGEWISNRVKGEIEANINSKKQVLIFLNRRGYAPLILCKECRYRFSCDMCSTYLVMHKKNNRLECHNCGAKHLIPKSCPECESKSLILYGPGIERIAEEIEKYFPDARIALISKEDTSNQEKFKELLLDIEEGKIDILIGTQIITKGYHFPKLTLVVVIDSDIGISGDMRASERMFQLLQQVSGRAGRERLTGNVLLQTYYPDNAIIKTIISQDEDAFINQELKIREKENMPPFGKMASVIVSGSNKEETYIFSKKLAMKTPLSEAKILGPAECMMLKSSGKYRYKILILASRRFNIQKYINIWTKDILNRKFKMKIDIDPYHFI